MVQPSEPLTTTVPLVEDLLTQLVAKLPAVPAPMGGVAPGRDDIAGTRAMLADFAVVLFVERDLEVVDTEVLYSAFSVHVGELMHRRGVDRAEAIRQACEVVRQAVREAQHQ